MLDIIVISIAAIITLVILAMGVLGAVIPVFLGVALLLKDWWIKETTPCRR